jgi:peptidoglycan hydrolase-like protein with peptidoglycan-binding domain
MKSIKTMLATASAIVLGVAGAGIAHAAELSSGSTNTPGSAMNTPRAMTASEILITAAQQQRKYSSLYNGSVDGKMGSETQRALRQFQQQQGLRQSGALLMEER